MIGRLARYVATKSLSREEHALADMVCADLTASGFRPQRQGANLWCELGDRPRPRLLLNSHLDTVPPGDGWLADPWTPRVKDGRLIGLGANDAKGCGVAMLEALRVLKAALDRGEPLGGTIVLALTAEEENSGAGLSTILDQLGPLDAALVGEPTGLVPMTAQRGLLILKCTAHGKTRHPANTPGDSADNAVLTAARDIAALPSFDWGPPHPLLGACHAHATMIQGGVARNVVPDRCEFWLDIRTTPNQPHAQAVERLRAVLRSEVSVHSDRLVPIETAAHEPLIQAVLRALPGARPQGSPAMSDMVFLREIPAVKIGPGKSTRSHTPEEYICESELKAGAEAYQRITREYFAMSDATSGAELRSAGGRPEVCTTLKGTK